MDSSAVDLFTLLSKFKTFDISMEIVSVHFLNFNEPNNRMFLSGQKAAKNKNQCLYFLNIFVFQDVS